jgi:hypothetical protein
MWLAEIWFGGPAKLGNAAEQVTGGALGALIARRPGLPARLSSRTGESQVPWGQG